MPRRLIDLRILSTADSEARRLEAVRQDRAVFDLRPGDPRPITIPRPVVFGPAQIALTDLPQIAEGVPAHQPRLAAFARPWPGEMAVWRRAPGWAP